MYIQKEFKELKPLDFMDFPASLTDEELVQAASSWTLKQWRQYLPKLTAGQIGLIVQSAASVKDPASWKEKTHILIDAVMGAPELEAVGRALSYEQMCEILTWIATGNEANRPKLFSLFVGLPHEIFLNALLHATPVQKNLLKQESHLEPIQHHLTLLTQALASASTRQNKEFSDFELQLTTFDLTTIDPIKIAEYESAIENLRKTCFSTQLMSSKALLLAWNTPRVDLIEKLSSIKEQSQKLSSQFIGIPSSQDSSSTGLYHLLETRLDTVFVNENNEPLSNEEPIIEALVKFSIWYIKDYWEIGLLPQILDPSQLDLESASEKERIEYREHLFATVRENLEKLELYTLADLKERRIYSKEALKRYIQQKSK